MSNTSGDRAFFISKKQSSMHLTLVIAGIGGFLLGLFANTGTSSMGIIVIFGLLMLATKKRPIVTIRDTHLEFKLAPLASLTLLRYEEIQNITNDNKKLLLTVNNKTKPIKLPKSFFNEEDFYEIEELLQKKINAVKTGI
jgi:hypothetical protein